jgi:hypothetical protein
MVRVEKKLAGLDHVGTHEKYLLPWRKLLWRKIMLASQSCLLSATAHVLRMLLLLGENRRRGRPCADQLHDGGCPPDMFFSSKSPRENETTIVVTLSIWTHLGHSITNFLGHIINCAPIQILIATQYDTK